MAAEIVVGLVGPVIEVVVGIVAPVKREFSYLCCLERNVQILEKETKDLENIRDDVQRTVDIALRNALGIDPEILYWLDSVSKIRQEKNELDAEIYKIRESGGLCMKSRYTASKRSAKIAAIMKQLSRLPRLTERRPIEEKPKIEFKSRKKTEEDLMAILKDGKVGLVGILGMGRVGKTTLANKIKNRVIKEHVFDKSVMVVVTHNADKQKIQGEIADQLGLELTAEMTLSSRADRLRAKLIDRKRRILVILDDVWEYLDLGELGIPCQTEGCTVTVLLTSRDRRVLTRMDAQKTCVVETLTEEEALSLFMEELQSTRDQNYLFTSLAREIARECKGLPFVLTIVAGELIYKEITTWNVAGKRIYKDISTWNDVLQQLRNSKAGDMPRVLNDVYAPLKLSYDYLNSQEAESMFLLCSLFPVDFNIPLEDLTAYAMGLGMFEGIGDLERARNKTEALVAMLKDCFLLFEGCDGRYVRMNGIIRLVAISIASNEKRLIKCGYDSTWISTYLGERIENSESTTFPNLRLLLVDNSDDKKLQIDDIPFEGMKELNVLSVNSDCSLASLPQTTEFLQNLHTLVLKNCRSLKTLCAVGELINLEVLYCRDCGSIEELPMEIGKLNQLKLLHISDCESLKIIAAGVISRLTRLEEMTLLRSFKKWESAALCELNSLSCLTTLRIEIEDVSLAAKQIHFPSKLVELDITIGIPTALFHRSRRYGKEVHLVFEREVIPGDWFRQLLGSTESLVLQGEGSSKLVPLVTKSQSLKQLIFLKAKMTRLSAGITTVFPVLESLCFNDIDDLEGIHDDGPISPDSFKYLQEIILIRLPKLQHLWNKTPHLCNLSSIYIAKCHSLCSLFASERQTIYDFRLRRVKIRSNLMLEQVVLQNEEENGQSRRRMGKLHYLDLCDLSKFKSLYRGIDSFEFTFDRNLGWRIES